ncbi:MAG: hypothetical protein E7411_02225 [Ruminococcaceae bacterium]|nr:hypothetical protein [Oscillospiraceae bacterium]
MKAVFLREIKAYFNSPLMYILMFIFLVVSFIFYLMYNIMSQYASMMPVMYSLNTMFLFLVPMLTMRLFSEEKTQKTDQLLFTSPNSITSLVMGKFFSAFFVFVIMMSLVAVYALITAIYGNLDIASFLIMYIGELLIGASFVAVGLFVSSVSTNLIISALVSFGLLLIFYFSEMIPGIFGNPEWLVKIFSFFSLSYRFDNFGMGLLAWDSIFYYLSFAGIFIFLTIRMIDKKRWS